MSGNDNSVLRVGNPLPRIAHVEPANGSFHLLVKWATGRRSGEEVIDVSPHLLEFKVYKPLRENPELFAKAAVSDDGSAVVWPGNADLEVSSDALEELAEDTTKSRKLASFRSS